MSHVSGGGLLPTLARFLLDGAGALFGLYLVLALVAMFWVLRCAPGTPTGILLCADGDPDGFTGDPRGGRTPAQSSLHDVLFGDLS